jgi:hypothetical protein
MGMRQRYEKDPHSYSYFQPHVRSRFSFNVLKSNHMERVLLGSVDLLNWKMIFAVISARRFCINVVSCHLEGSRITNGDWKMSR